MKSILQQSMLLLFILGLTSAVGFSQKKVANSQHKIVIQFSSGDTLAQKGLKNNLKNLTTAWPDASIEVVCHGPGISFVRTETTKYAEDIINFKKMGIVFAACENTLKERKIEKSEILPGIQFVPNGLVEVITKQEKGWSYIKAGY